MDDETKETVRPPVARRIAQARERSGLSHGAIAARLGITKPAYYDLESDDHELFMNLSLSQVSALGRIFGLTVHELIDGEGSDRPLERLTHDDLAGRIRDQIRVEGTDAEAWSDKVGWEVTSVLADPGTTPEVMNLDMLMDVCEALALDWRTVEIA